MFASESSPVEYDVCQEQYDDEARCPRIFDCFHTICNTCVAKLIKNKTKQCPFCRKPFVANTPKDVTVNHSTLELIKYILMRETKVNEPLKDHCVFQPKWVNDMKEEAKKMSNHHINKCQETQQQIEKTIAEITDLKTSIQKENIKIETEVCHKFYTIIARNTKEIEELEKTIGKLKSNSKDLVDRNKTLEALKGKLKLCAAKTFKDSAVLLDEAMIVNTTTGDWIKSVKDTVSAEGMMLELAQEKLKRREENISSILKSLELELNKEKDVDSNEGFWKGTFVHDCAINLSKNNNSSNNDNINSIPAIGPSAVLVMHPARYALAEAPPGKRHGKNKRR